MKISVSRKIFRVLGVILIIFTLLSLCGCFGLIPFPDTDESKKPSGGKDEEELSDYVSEIYDIYFDGKYFAIDIADSTEVVKIYAWADIGGERLTIEDGQGVGGSGEGERNTYYADVPYELEQSREPTFTVTAYSESTDGTKRSAEKTVTFENAMIVPTLDTKTGILTWRDSEIYEYFDVIVYYPPMTSIEYHEQLTEGSLDVSEIANPRGFSYYPVVRIGPNVREDVETKTFFYTKEAQALRIGKQTLDDLCLTSTGIQWQCHDYYIFDTEDPSVFTLTIEDGGEVIERTVTVNPGEGHFYPYQPRTESLKITVKGGVPHPMLVECPAITVEPTCIGNVSNLRVDGSYVKWDFNTVDESATEDNYKFVVRQDGEIIAETTKNLLAADQLNVGEGYTNIEVAAVSTYYNDYCLGAPTLDIFRGKAPSLHLESYDGKSVDIVLTETDERAIGYKIRSEYSYRTPSVSIDVPNEGEGTVYTFTPPGAGYYSLYAYPVYDTPFLPAISENAVTVQKRPETTFYSTSYEDGTWYLNLKSDVALAQTPYTILSDKAGEDISNTAIVNSYGIVKIPMPESVSSSYDERSMTVKVTSSIGSFSDRHVDIPSDETVYNVKKLPAPDITILEGVISWVYDSGLPNKGFKLNVTYYDPNTYEEKSILSGSTSALESSNLLNRELAAGSYYTSVVALADNSGYSDGGIIYMNSTPGLNSFYKCKAPEAYASGTDTLAFKNSGYYPPDISVRIYATDAAGTPHEYSTTVEGDISEIEVLGYFAEWGVDEIFVDAVTLASPSHMDSDVKTYRVRLPKITGLTLSNSTGTLAWDSIFEDITYDYVLTAYTISNDSYQVVSGEALSLSELDVKTPILAFIKGHANESFPRFALALTAQIPPEVQEGQAGSEILTLAPDGAMICEFYGLSYTVSMVSKTALAIEFNKEFDTVPNVTLKTTGGTYLGKKSADNADFTFSSLSAGNYTLVFESDVQSAALDESLMLKLPYYHTMKMLGEAEPMGYFSDFKAGSYVFSHLPSCGFSLDSDESDPATVVFNVTTPGVLVFNGDIVNADDGTYVLDLYKANHVSLTVSATKGFVDANTYQLRDSTATKTFGFTTVEPPRPVSCRIDGSTLIMKFSGYSETARVDVTVNGGLINDEPLPISSYSYTAHLTVDDSSLLFTGNIIIVRVYETTESGSVECDYSYRVIYETPY